MTYSFPSAVLGSASFGDASCSWSYLASGDLEFWDASSAQVTSTSTSSDENAPRKRGANPSTWRRTISKKALDRGLEHINAKGQPVKARKLGPNCGPLCRFKCSSRLSEDTRLSIFNTFWGIGNHTGQWEFISRHCELYQPKQRKRDAIKPISASRKYFFRNGPEIIYVCKRMFCNTLDISEKWVHTALRRRQDDDTVAPDRRGKHPKIGKILKSVKDSVREHIQLIPKVDTRVGRMTRQYAEDGMSIRAMHRLYVDWMDQNAGDGNKPLRKASERQYRDIFLAEYKVGFYKRTKDECGFCQQYEGADSDEKQQLQSRYDLHCANMEALRECRVKDRCEMTPAKDAAGPVSSICCACFDLVKVFATPKSENNELQYRKRLSVYDFNVYDTANHEGVCFFWDEGIARIGDNEIVSCLMYYIEMQFEENGIREFRFYSGSSDFNKSKYLFSMYCYVASKLGVEVTHRYFEQGHTQNECDGIVGVIERACKADEIFVPSQWHDAAREAKKTGKPYRVIRLSQDHVYDFHCLAKNLHWRRDATGEKIRWNEVKEVAVSSDKITLRYNLAMDLCVEVPAQAGCPVVSSWKLERLYDAPLPIASDKFEDLMALCDSSVIPEEYHEFYRSFKSAPNVVEAPRRYYNDADPSEEGVLSDAFDDSDNE